ncbi:MAG: hypothetical protein CMM48_03310 [Rhodospirillaceae bacterium]|nr:hypothetical protein [Rhodospirillaceae bacterium]
MPRIALIGAGGFVGGSIAKSLSTKSEADVVEVTRTNYDAARDDGSYDVLINSAMPSKRFWARQNPADDFVEPSRKPPSWSMTGTPAKLSRSVLFPHAANSIRSTGDTRPRPKS